MGRYTESSNPKVDQQLQLYLDIIVKLINEKVGDTVSIILSGGFGRGEGSFSLENGRVRPLNDLDIYLVTKKKKPEGPLNEIAAQAQRMIGSQGIPMYIYDRERVLNSNDSYSQLFYVDLKALSLGYFRHLPPMTRYYDLINAGTVISGRQDIFKEAIDYQLKDLPLAEGLRLLLNRMSHLLQYLPFKASERKRSHQVVLFFTAKAYLAIAAALLQLSGKYQSSYRKNMEIFARTFTEDFPELSEKMPDLPKRVREFTEFKLRPDFSLYQDRDFDLWHQARTDIGIVSQYFLSQYIGRSINNWDDFSHAVRRIIWPKYYRSYLQYYLKKNFKLNIRSKTILSIITFFAKIVFNVLYFGRIWRYQKKFHPRALFGLSSPELNFFSAMPYLLYSLDKNQQVDRKMLAKGRIILNRCYPTTVNIKDNKEYWSKLALDYCNAYTLFAFLKIV